MRIIEGLDQNLWSFQKSFWVSLLVVLGVITSLLNHGLTSIVFQWIDRVTIVLLVMVILGPSIWTSSLSLSQACIFLGCLAFVWSKLNSDDTDTMILSHRVSHAKAAWASLIL